MKEQGSGGGVGQESLRHGERVGLEERQIGREVPIGGNEVGRAKEGPRK